MRTFFVIDTVAKWALAVTAVSCPFSLLVGRFFAAGRGPEIEDEAEKEKAA